MAEAIKVLVVDDDEQVRTGLRYQLGHDPRLKLVAEAYDGRSALREVERARPDVIMLDLVMPTMDGYHAIPQIQMSAPDAKIVILTDADVEPLALMYRGAAAVLRKSDALEGTAMADKLVDLCAADSYF